MTTEINALIDKYLTGVLPLGEESVLFEWLQSSSDNLEYFRERESKWKQSHPVSYVESSSLQSTNDRLSAAIRKKSFRTFRRIFVPAVAAASLTVGVFMAFHPFASEHEKQYHSYSAPMGSKSSLILPDGSVVTINSGSTVRYSSDFNKTEREIELNGEAFFDVAHDSSRPFVVRAGKCTLTVLGTKFDVSAYGDDAEVMTALIEGKLKIETPSSSGILNPGDVASVQNEQLTIEKADAEQYTGWSSGKIKFDRISVPSFLKRLSREYGVEISLETNSFDESFFRASFSYDNSIESILEMMCEIFPMKYQKVGNGYKISD